MMRSTIEAEGEITTWERVRQISWPLILLVAMTAAVGFAMLYSAAGGSLEPWAQRQMMRFGIGLALLLGICLIDLRLWFKLAYLVYVGGIALLAAVELAGEVGMGAQRWLDLGVIQLQPSELMKIAVVLALARYFHRLNYDEIGRIPLLIIPTLLVVVPVGLVLRQPNLGTAVMLLGVGAAVFFLAGVRIWKFVLIIAVALAAIPIGWNFLHDYQKQRVLTFLDPSIDPLGAGYHITQSKIALGSGGMWGKGFLQGTQGHLQFIPEKQTDFILAILAEEFGIVGGLTLMGLYVLLLAYGFAIALRSRNQFGRLLALGLSTNLFLYAFINMAMVMGLIPVVGVPLPLMSYGGTSMLALLISFGLIMNVYIHRDVHIGRRVGERET